MILPRCCDRSSSRSPCCTGFTGLAYEVTWQKYLAILLGAHSEATAAVLGLFLGGLSLGYWLFGALTRALVARGRRSGRPAPLLLVYGAVEAGIGVYCLLFPWLFPLVRSASVWLPTGDGRARLRGRRRARGRC